jgi:hypothetical protein
MSTITVSRTDLTSDEVSGVLRQALGPRYNVLPGRAVNRNPVGDPRPDHPDTIVVGTGSNRFFRAQVRISRSPRETVLHVSPGGITLVPRLTNRLGIARKVHQALAAAQSLG